MYTTFIRPLMPYEQLSRIIRRLEAMRNVAIKIILGCSNTIKVLNKTIELGFPSIMDRNTEMITVITTGLFRSPDDDIAKDMMFRLAK